MWGARAPRTEADLAAFVAWLTAQGAHFSGVEPVATPGHGFALRATRDLPARAIVLSVPRALLFGAARSSPLGRYAGGSRPLTVRRASRCAHLRPVLAETASAELSTLALWLLFESLDAGSAVQPYLCALPRPAELGDVVTHMDAPTRARYAADPVLGEALLARERRLQVRARGQPHSAARTNSGWAAGGDRRRRGRTSAIPARLRR